MPCATNVSPVENSLFPSQLSLGNGRAGKWDNKIGCACFCALEMKGAELDGLVGVLLH